MVKFCNGNQVYHFNILNIKVKIMHVKSYHYQCLSLQLIFKNMKAKVKIYTAQVRGTAYN